MILGALAIGLTLGLLGSGGSILTVPLLVYALGHDGKTAIAESLAIVGTIALMGMLPYARRRQVDWKSVAFFGLPGMVGTYAGAWLAKFVGGPVQLVLFAIVMLLAAVMMFRRASRAEGGTTASSGSSGVRHSIGLIVLDGLAVGTLTGLVGVGGGFLIVPALVILGGLPMRLAVGTSLVVVSLQSFSGFLKYLGLLNSLGGHIDWQTVGVFAGVGIVGSLIGNVLSQHINQQALRRAFAGFLVVMGLFVLGREIPHVLTSRRVAVIEATESMTQVLETVRTSISMTTEVESVTGPEGVLP
ncbi:TSUP family transporter [bacterium]|nr:TSUP family transporter [bacterium]